VRFVRINKKGFTLIELMIVVAIIAILVMFSLPNFARYRSRALVGGAVASCESIRSAMALYAVDSPGNLFPVDQWEDGAAGWESFRRFMAPLGTTLKQNMREQGFADFTYETIAVDDEDGADYIFIFRSAGSAPTQPGALIEVRPSGVSRWTGSL